MLPRTIATFILTVFVLELTAMPHSQTKDEPKNETKRCTNPTKRRAWQVSTPTPSELGITTTQGP